MKLQNMIMQQRVIKQERGEYEVDNSFTLISGKIGSSYALTDSTNIYASIASANQAPTTSELGDNEDLEKSQSINYEVGLKTRTDNLAYDLTSTVQAGGGYAYSHFKFDTFNESVKGSLISRDGNYLPYIPKNQYSLFIAYNLTN